MVDGDGRRPMVWSRRAAPGLLAAFASRHRHRRRAGARVSVTGTSQTCVQCPFGCRAALLRVGAVGAVGGAAACGRSRCRGWRRRVPQPDNRGPRGVALAGIPSDLSERATAAVRSRIARSDTNTVPERANDPRAVPIARSNMPPADRAPTAPPAPPAPLTHQNRAARETAGDCAPLRGPCPPSGTVPPFGDCAPLRDRLRFRKR